MQLSFLGQSYQASIPTIEATATAEVGTFLGKTYVRKQFHVSQRQSAPEELTFLGKKYIR